MGLSIGALDIYTRLVNDITVTGIIDTFNSNPAIFNDLTIPETMIEDRTINIYQSSVNLGSLCYNDLVFTINCRAGRKSRDNGGYSDSISIQNAVFTSLNRKQDGYLFSCSTLPPIPPADKEDNYNSPVECRVRKQL